MKSTTKCIICLEKAEIWTGHVLYGSRREKVTAGWCKKHISESENIQLMKGAACFGEYLNQYGIQINE